MRYWLMKTEPAVFSILDLKELKSTAWEGVRNYQARNFMKSMNIGDRILIYHSNAPVIGIVGEARVSADAHPDATQFDAKSDYYDPRSKRENPRWWCVDISFENMFETVVELSLLRSEPLLSGMELLKKGQRLSVMPLQEKEYKHILNMTKCAR